MPLTPVALVAAVLALFAVRSIYRLLLPEAIDGDAIFHLHVIEDTRQNGHRVPEQISQVATKGYFAYPHLLHRVLSYLPQRYVMVVERFFSPLSELAFVGVLLLLVPFGVLSLEGVVFVTILLVLTPQFVRPDMAHSIGMSARKPGLVLTTLSVLLFLQWHATGQLAFLGAAVLIGAAIFPLSKFSVQALLFIAIGFTVSTSVVALPYFAAALLLAVLLTRGRYLKVLRVHLLFLADFAKNKQYKKLDQSLPSPIGFVRGLWNADSPMDVMEVVHKSRLRPFLDFPVIVSALLAYGIMAVDGTAISMPPGYHAWIATGLVAMALISLPHLLFLGRPERYFEYVFLPAAVLVARAWPALGPEYRAAVVALHVVAAGLIGVYIWGFKNVFFAQDRYRAFRDVVAEIEDEPPGTLLVHPSRLAKRAAWQSEHTIVDTIGNQASTPEAVEELNRLFPDQYAYVTKDVAWLKETYDPDWVIFDLEKVEEHPEAGLDVPDTEPIYSNGTFELYRFDVLVLDRSSDRSRHSGLTS